MDFEVLICGSDVNAYYMARLTHEAYRKKAYVLIKNKLAYTTYSKIINHIYNDKIWNEDAFIKAVNDLADELNDKKLVVISSNETYANFLTKNRDKLRGNILYNYPSVEIIQSLMDKEKFYKTYEKSCLDFPKTTYYNPNSSNDIFVDFQFPVIVKPANVIIYNKVEFPHKKKVYKVDTMDELKQIFDYIKSSDYDDDLIIQEYIPGDDSYLFDSVVYCDKQSNVSFISLAQIGLQEHSPNMVGNAAVLINGFSTFDINREDIENKIKSFMEKIKYVGFAEFDLKYDYRDGKFKVLEINARQGRCSYYVSLCGFNLVKVLVDDLVYDKKIPYTFLDKKIMLTFVNRKIIKKYVKNPKFKSEALRLYKYSVNPLKYRDDRSIYRKLLYLKRDNNYKKSFSMYKWD